MDPLALLSGDEDDEEDDGGGAGAGDAEAQAAAGEPAAKRPKTDALDFDALQRAGYSSGGASEESERHAARASLDCSFAALQQAAQSNQPALPPPEPAAPSDAPRRLEPEFGCELPPDSVEVFDESGAQAPPPWPTFEDAGAFFQPSLIDCMKGQGFLGPMPIQAHTWPILAAGRDLIGVAKTGSGKTLAFLLPCFARILQEGLRTKVDSGGDLPVQMQKQAAGPGAYSPEILILAPSRELAMQIESEAKKFTPSTGIATLACYGGEGLRKGQLGQLRERPECVVGTVGRLNDFIQNERSWFGVKNVRFLILDEADLMLGEGLDDKIRAITLDVETPRRQTMMFSATFAPEVSDLATWILRNPVEVRVGMRDPLRANPDIDQRIIIVKDDVDKEGALKTVLRKQYSSHSGRSTGKVLIFAEDPEQCETLAKKLKSALNCAEIETLHGNRKQADRERAMAAFRSGDIPMLVATSVAGRGLDVKDIDLVVNFDPPEDGQDYVHRIGRTGRAGERGVAMTLLRKGPDGRAMIYIAQVMRRTGKPVPPDLIAALKQRRGRDTSDAVEALQGLCSFESVDRKWAKAI